MRTFCKTLERWVLIITHSNHQEQIYCFTATPPTRLHWPAENFQVPVSHVKIIQDGGLAGLKHMVIVGQMVL